MHHIPAPAPQPPSIVPVIVSGTNQGQQQPQGNQQFKGNFKNGNGRPFTPPENQYRNQPCNISGHYSHLNKDCKVQTNIPCSYNAGHQNHKAIEWMSRDWQFGALQ